MLTAGEELEPDPQLLFQQYQGSICFPHTDVTQYNQLKSCGAVGSALTDMSNGDQVVIFECGLLAGGLY